MRRLFVLRDFSQQETYGCKINMCFAVHREALIVLRQPPVLTEPGKRAFDDPAKRHRGKAPRPCGWGANLNLPPQGRLHPIGKWFATVALIRPELCDTPEDSVF